VKAVRDSLERSRGERGRIDGGLRRGQRIHVVAGVACVVTRYRPRARRPPAQRVRHAHSSWANTPMSLNDESGTRTGCVTSRAQDGRRREHAAAGPAPIATLPMMSSATCSCGCPGCRRGRDHPPSAGGAGGTKLAWTSRPVSARAARCRSSGSAVDVDREERGRRHRELHGNSVRSSGLILEVAGHLQVGEPRRDGARLVAADTRSRSLYAASSARRTRAARSPEPDVVHLAADVLHLQRLCAGKRTSVLAFRLLPLAPDVVRRSTCARRRVEGVGKRVEVESEVSSIVSAFVIRPLV